MSLTFSAPVLATWPAGAQAPSGSRPPSRPDSVLVALERRGWEGAKRKDSASLVEVMGPDGFLFVAPWGTHRVSREWVATEVRDCQTVSDAMDSIAVIPASENSAVLRTA